VELKLGGTKFRKKLNKGNTENFQNWMTQALYI